MGLKENMASIKGFDEALADIYHPVYSCTDHPTWKSTEIKHPRFHYSHTHGDAYFCIPPYPFAGEVE